jgi:hypothetical protein
MMRRFCVLAFCAANYKRSLCKAQIRFRTVAKLHICFYDSQEGIPAFAHLHFVKDEVFAL